MLGQLRRRLDMRGVADHARAVDPGDGRVRDRPYDARALVQLRCGRRRALLAAAAFVALLSFIELVTGPGAVATGAMVLAAAAMLFVCVPVAMARCPRCGSFFFPPRGRAWHGFWLHRRRCGDCGLRLDGGA